MKLERKEAIVADLRGRFSRSKVVILCDYKGLNVQKVNELRKRLKEEEIEFQVVKNSLLVRASRETEVEAIIDHFRGPNAVAISYHDLVAPAKVLTKFADENDHLDIRVGVMKGKVLDVKAVRALSALPPREILLGQLLSTMNAVPTGLVRLLAKIPGGFLNVLQALKEKKEAA